MFYLLSVNHILFIHLFIHSVFKVSLGQLVQLYWCNFQHLPDMSHPNLTLLKVGIASI
jgi:hypothetical protein